MKLTAGSSARDPVRSALHPRGVDAGGLPRSDLLLANFRTTSRARLFCLRCFWKIFGGKWRAVFISANGGYRSPAQIGGAKSIHAWGTAANIYRVGDTFLDDAKSIERYGAIASSLSQAVLVRPFDPTG
jgi:hypothetical protein